MAQSSTRTTRGRHRGPVGARSGARQHGVVLVARRVGQVVAALVSACLLLAMAYYRQAYADLNQGIKHVTVGGLGTTQTGGSQVTRVDGKAQNLLLIGDDSREGLSEQEIKKLGVGIADGGSTSTDTLLIVHVPADGSKATLISIPRDSYVDIPGFKSSKINAAYIDGYTYGIDGYPVTSSSTQEQQQSAGLTLLNQVVHNLTGVDITDDVMVNFVGFYNIAKAIHGIDVDLCHAVDDRAAVNEHAGLGAVGSGFRAPAGKQHLDPVDALKFVRQRHNIYNAKHQQLNDEGREARQRYFLAAAFKAMQSSQTLLSPSRLSALIDAVKRTLTIGGDLPLLSLAHQMVDLESGNIVGQTIPTDGDATIDGQDVLKVQPAKVQAQVQKWLSPTAAPSPARHPSSTSRASTPHTGSASSSATVQQADKGCIN